MILEIVNKLSDLHKAAISQFGKKYGEEFFDYLINTALFNLRTKEIIHELDLFKTLYDDSLFYIIEKFYDSKTKKEKSEIEKKFMSEVYKINGGAPTHTYSDEITLLFYVGLYHKIENYENEILQFYNDINKTNHKNLKSIGINIAEKKNLFEDRDRIRLICNSIKHNNYYPKKELLKYYPYLDLDKKISLNNFNPNEDIELIKIYINYFNMLITFSTVISTSSQLNQLKELKGFKELKIHFTEITENISYKNDKQKLSYLSKQKN